MGCCESTPAVPDELIPDPEQGPCHFVVKKLSSFNSDYEVYRDEVDKSNRWLFLNRIKQGNHARIDLENYVRLDPEKPKQGQVLWSVQYDEDPHYSQEYDGDSSDDEWGLVSWFNPGPRMMKLKWKVESTATITGANGMVFHVKMKAKGDCYRVVKMHRDEEGHLQKHYEDSEFVKKITYKIKDASGETFDKFKLQGDVDDGSDCVWDCGAFTATKTGGWFTDGNLEVHTKPEVHPGFGLLMAHICATEFGPNEIKADLHPDWHYFDWYDSDGWGSYSD